MTTPNHHNPIVNRAAARDMLYRMMKARRPALADRMERVSEAFFNDLEIVVRERIDYLVSVHPTVGKTFKP